MNYAFFTMYLLFLPVFGWAAFSLMSAYLLYRPYFARKGGEREAANVEERVKALERAEDEAPPLPRETSPGSPSTPAEGDALPGEEVYLRAADKTPLFGKWTTPGDIGIDSTAASAVVVLLHGLGGNSADMEGLARGYLAAGYTILSTDLRSHGNSGGVWRTMGALESADLGKWVDWLAVKAPGAKIAVHGDGIGASVAIRYAAGYAYKATDKPRGPSPLSALVLDRPALDAGSSYRRKVRSVLGPFPFSAGTLFFSDLVSVGHCGVPVSAMDARPAPYLPDPLSRIHIPVLLFDRNTPDESGEFHTFGDRPDKADEALEFLRRIL